MYHGVNCRVSHVDGALRFEGVQGDVPRSMYVSMLPRYVSPRFPLLSSMFDAEGLFIETSERGKNVDSFTIATAEGINRLSKTYLEPLGATTLLVAYAAAERYLDSGKFTAEEIVDGLEAGYFLATKHPVMMTHDVIDHKIPEKCLPDEGTVVLQEAAGLSRSLRRTQPEMARGLAVNIALALETQASFHYGRDSLFMQGKPLSAIAGRMPWPFSEGNPSKGGAYKEAYPLAQKVIESAGMKVSNEGVVDFEEALGGYYASVYGRLKQTPTEADRSLLPDGQLHGAVAQALTVAR